MNLSRHSNRRIAILITICLFLGGIPLVYFLYSCCLEARNAGVPVLMYHEVVESKDHEGRYSITRAKFEEQLKYLQVKGYKTISDSEFLAACSGAQPLPEKPVLLTFDDGSTDHYTRVYPLLKKYGFTGVFFVITGRINKPGHLNLAQLVEMSKGGMSIQSHSGSARLLNSLHPEEARAEMTQSKVTLEQILRTDTISFCLPGGRSSQTILDQLKSSGYRLVFSSDAGTNPAGESPFLMKRLEIRGTISAGDFSKFDSPCRIVTRKSAQRFKKLLRR